MPACRTFPWRGRRRKSNRFDGSLRGYTLRLKPFTNKLKRLHIRINTGFRNRHELSIVVFAAQGRPLPVQASSRVGAVDADAGGKTLACAAAAQRRVLCAAR